MRQPFRIVHVMGLSFRIFPRNLPLLFGLVLLVNLPRIGYGIYSLWTASPDEGSPMPEDPAELLAWLLPLYLESAGGMLVSKLFVRLSQAVVIFAVYRALQGGAATFAGSLRGGLHRAIPVLLVALALSAIELVVGLVVSIPFWLLIDLEHPIRWEYLHIAAGLGLLVMTPFWVAIPAAVVERSQNFLKTSWRLTRGHWFAVFVILIAIYAMQALAQSWIAPHTYEFPRAVSVAIWVVFELLFMALSAVFAVVGYQALRLEKEGVDVARLKDVFR